MGRCRYNLPEECHNKDCVKCILEKIKAEIEEYGSIWVQYSIKGHTNKDIEDIVNDVIKQAKQSFIQRLDNHIAELKGEQE